MSELGRAEDNAFTMLETMTKYFVSRAKLVSKVIFEYLLSYLELSRVILRYLF